MIWGNGVILLRIFMCILITTMITQFSEKKLKYKQINNIKVLVDAASPAKSVSLIVCLCFAHVLQFSTYTECTLYIINCANNGAGICPLKTIVLFYLNCVSLSWHLLRKYFIFVIYILNIIFSETILLDFAPLIIVIWSKVYTYIFQPIGNLLLLINSQMFLFCCFYSVIGEIMFGKDCLYHFKLMKRIPSNA